MFQEIKFKNDTFIRERLEKLLFWCMFCHHLNQNFIYVSQLCCVCVLLLKYFILSYVSHSKTMSYEEKLDSGTNIYFILLVVLFLQILRIGKIMFEETFSAEIRMCVVFFFCVIIFVETFLRETFDQGDLKIFTTTWSVN